MTIIFEEATREQAKLRVAIEGPAKSGKTFTALVLATAAAKRFGGKIAFVDTERGSASKYAPKPGQRANPNKGTFKFQQVELQQFSPRHFIEAIEAAQQGGFTILVVDSLSHEWMGTGGVLQMVEADSSRNRFAAWKTPSLLHQKLVDTMLQSNLHIICTMRSKMKHVQEQEGNRTVIRKVGMEPVQRSGMEYEFDVVLSLDTDNNCRVSGSRCPEMPNGTAENQPGAKFFAPLLNWVSEGSEPKPKPVQKAKPASPPTKAEDIATAIELPKFHDMNDFYARAEQNWKRDKDTIVAALTAALGKTVLKAQREDGVTMADLWAVLEQHMQAAAAAKEAAQAKIPF